MNNKSKTNTSKGKIYLSVVAIAAVLMMSLNLNANMNTNINAYASIFSDIQNADDVGQSLECVIVVVGCDGTGSVGSSGDVIIGSGNDDNNTNGGDGGVIPVDPTECELCLETDLTTEQLSALAVALGLDATADVTAICEALDALASVTLLVEILGEIELSPAEIVALLDCLGIEITIEEVIAILGPVTVP